MRFLLNGHKARLDFGDTTTVTHGHQTFSVPNTNQKPLIGMYTLGLNPEIAKQIILAGQPETINLWMTRVVEIDSAYRRTRNHV